MAHYMALILIWPILHDEGGDYMKKGNFKSFMSVDVLFWALINYFIFILSF